MVFTFLVFIGNCRAGKSSFPKPDRECHPFNTQYTQEPRAAGPSSAAEPSAGGAVFLHTGVQLMSAELKSQDTDPAVSACASVPAHQTLSIVTSDKSDDEIRDKTWSWAWRALLQGSSAVGPEWCCRVRDASARPATEMCSPTPGPGLAPAPEAKAGSARRQAPAAPACCRFSFKASPCGYGKESSHTPACGRVPSRFRLTARLPADTHRSTIFTPEVR